MEVFDKGEQFEVGSSYRVLAVNAGGNGELTVGSLPAHESECLVCKDQVVLNEFFEFIGIVATCSRCTAPLSGNLGLAWPAALPFHQGLTPPGDETAAFVGLESRLQSPAVFSGRSGPPLYSFSKGIGRYAIPAHANQGLGHSAPPPHPADGEPGADDGLERLWQVSLKSSTMAQLS